MGAAKTIFYIVLTCILIWIAYFVYQTYLWFGNVLSPSSDLPADDSTELKDYIKFLNDALKKLIDLFRNR